MRRKLLQLSQTGIDRPLSGGQLVRGELGKTPATLLNFQSAAMAAASTYCRLLKIEADVAETS